MSDGHILNGKKEKGVLCGGVLFSDLFDQHVSAVAFVPCHCCPASVSPFSAGSLCACPPAVRGNLSVRQGRCVQLNMAVGGYFRR